jgi:ferredoxin
VSRAVARPGKRYAVSIRNIGKTIDCGANETVLHAAVRAGIDYPYACATGNCGECLSELEGKVSLLPHGDGALSVAQKTAGRTLACRARPRGDVAVTWLGRARK